MTQHNFFEAYFYTQADWAQTTIKAKTPELALQRARQIESEKTETLDFQRYDGGGGVEHIEIQSADGSTVAEWRSEDLLVRLAAQDLLEALRIIMVEASSRKENGMSGIASIARAAITKAKPQH